MSAVSFFRDTFIDAYVLNS